MFCSSSVRGEGRKGTRFSSSSAGPLFLFSHRQDQLSISDVELCGGTADVGNKNLWPLSSFKGGRLSGLAG